MRAKNYPNSYNQKPRTALEKLPLPVGNGDRGDAAAHDRVEGIQGRLTRYSEAFGLWGISGLRCWDLGFQVFLPPVYYFLHTY